ncbi:NXPE family member 2-like [Hyperolius riggenbachi]|uniref:NXPE family member 2-like n=1 Tax=Hyperolius riggenbachi TaxID=752182 RepID=UPI0035A3A0D0
MVCLLDRAMRNLIEHGDEALRQLEKEQMAAQEGSQVVKEVNELEVPSLNAEEEEQSAAGVVRGWWLGEDDTAQEEDRHVIWDCEDYKDLVANAHLLPMDLKLYNVHGTSWHKTNMAYDLKNNIYIQWKKHGHPLVTLSFFNMKDHSYTTNEIDRLAGGPNTIIVITLGQHFRPFPLPVFIKRILNVRSAIERLFLRSPDTKVILKSENTRDINTDVERFSDFHGYIQYLVIQNIFSGLNVGVIDVWDMTVAFGSHNVHPPVEVVRNQINLFLSYIC